MEEKVELVFELEKKVNLLIQKYQEVISERDMLFEKLVKAEESLSVFQDFYQEDLNKKIDDVLECDNNSEKINLYFSSVNSTASSLKSDSEIENF